MLELNTKQTILVSGGENLRCYCSYSDGKAIWHTEHTTHCKYECCEEENGIFFSVKDVPYFNRANGTTYSEGTCS